MTSDPRPTADAVLFVTRKWPPAIGGMETYAVELTRELGQRVPIEIIPLPGRSDGSPPSFFPLAIFALRTVGRYLMRPQPPAILHIADMASWPLGLLARTRRPAPAVILSAHGTDVSYPRRGGLKGRLYGAYQRAGARLLGHAKVIANSAATARAARENGWPEPLVVPLATRLAGATEPARHGGHILFAGRLIRLKGCRWFIDNVLPLLPPGIQLHVAGAIWDRSEGDALDDPRVTYLGTLHGKDLIDAYRSALCVVLPNIEPSSGAFEGFGLVAAEAAASGGVVLAAACGGLTEAVIDGETGFLLPSGIAGAWRDRIEAIAGWAPGTRSRFVRQAMTSAQRHFSWPRVADEVLAIYRDARTAPVAGGIEG